MLFQIPIDVLGGRVLDAERPQEAVSRGGDTLAEREGGEAKLTKNEATAANKRATNLRQIARAKTAEGEASETVVESVVETVVVVVPYTGEPTSLNNDEVAAILGREGMDEDMGRQDSTNSVVEEIIVNTVSGSHLPELGEHFWINLCFLK